MQVYAETKYVRMSPRKVRLVAHAVRRLSLDRALTFLASIPKRAALPVLKTVKSAIANAEHNHEAMQNQLKLVSIQVNEGPTFKRWRAVSRGNAHGYAKRTSHIQVVLDIATTKKISKNSTKLAQKELVKRVEKSGNTGGVSRAPTSVEARPGTDIQLIKAPKTSTHTKMPTRQKKGM